MYCTNTLRIVIISIAMVLAFVAAVNPRRARAPPTILGCSCLSTSFSRSSAYSARTFITPTPVPNQTRLSAFLLLAQNSFPNLNVHTGVPPTEEARRRENVSECRKLVVGLGTDGPRVDSGLFELAGTVDGSLDLIVATVDFLLPFHLLPNRLIPVTPSPTPPFTEALPVKGVTLVRWRCPARE